MRTARWEDSETVRLMLIASSTASRTELATDRPVNFLSFAPYGVESRRVSAGETDILQRLQEPQGELPSKNH